MRIKMALSLLIVVLLFLFLKRDGEASGLWAGLSDGSRFNTTQWAEWTTNSQMKVLVGDFNGDGKTDVMKFDVPTSGSMQLGLWVGLSDGTRFNPTQWATWTTNSQMKVLVGDFNGDGKTDVMKFDVPASGTGQNGLWVGLSDGSRFNTAQWATWTTNSLMMVLSGNFDGDRPYGRPRHDVMKFDVPAPESAKSQCRAEGGIWIDIFSYCSKALGRVYGVAATILNPEVLAYKAYFQIVGGGATMRALPDYVVTRLTGHFDKTMLARVQHGASKHTASDDTAMTDCDKIYFPDGRGHVAAITDGKLFAKDSSGYYVYRGSIHLLLHELTHVQQCINWGGRENYATNWFGQLGSTTLEELFTDPAKVSNRRIHNSMPMEGKATENADRILSQL